MKYEYWIPKKKQTKKTYAFQFFLVAIKIKSNAVSIIKFNPSIPFLM